jgi:hypothetical protein
MPKGSLSNFVEQTRKGYSVGPAFLAVAFAAATKGRPGRKQEFCYPD